MPVTGVQPPMRRRWWILVLPLLVSCSLLPSGGSPDGDWRLLSGQLRGTAIEPLEEAPITLTIAGSQLSGSTGCNSYGGAISVRGGAISITELDSTLIGCERAQTEVETAYLEALRMTERGRRDGTRLTLTGSDAELVFEVVRPQGDAPLVGTRWTLESVTMGDAVASFAGIEAVTLEFDEDGVVRGTTACSEFAARYAVGATIIIEPVTVPAGDCAEPAATLERQVVPMLARGLSGTIQEDRLTLGAGAGGALDYRAAP